jgi:hypothetical protein
MSRHVGPARAAVAVAAAVVAGLLAAWLTRPPGPAEGQGPAAPAAHRVTGSPGGVARAASAAEAATAPSVRARPATPSPSASSDPPSALLAERLDIRMPVVPVGVAVDGQMALPGTPDEAGWYRYGAAPGDAAGAIVIAGHLDMPGYGVGPMARLDELRAGDVVMLRTHVGHERYIVENVDRVRKTRLDLDALFRRDGPPRLHIVTCGGRFDREAGRYDENVVVVATPTR